MIKSRTPRSETDLVIFEIMYSTLTNVIGYRYKSSRRTAGFCMNQPFEKVLRN